MKKIKIISCICLLLCGVFIVCISAGYRQEKAAELEMRKNNLGEPIGGRDTSALYKKPANYHDYRNAVLLTLVSNNPTLVPEGALDGSGFVESEIISKDFGVGMPYAIFAFDRQGQQIDKKTQLVISLKNNNTYIGKATVEYDEDLGKNNVKVLKEDLVSRIQNGTVDTKAVLTIGKVGSKTFVTDGVNLDILAAEQTSSTDDLSDDELKALAPVFKAAAGEKYNYICGYFISTIDI